MNDTTPIPPVTPISVSSSSPQLGATPSIGADITSASSLASSQPATLGAVPSSAPLSSTPTMTIPEPAKAAGLQTLVASEETVPSSSGSLINNPVAGSGGIPEINIPPEILSVVAPVTESSSPAASINPVSSSAAPQVSAPVATPSVTPTITPPAATPVATSNLSSTSPTESVPTTPATSSIPASEVTPPVSATPPATPSTPPTSSSAFSANLPVSILDVLLRMNALTQDQVNDLIAQQIQSGRRAEELIAEKRLVPEETYSKAQAEVFSVPFVKIADMGVSPEALAVLPESVARRYGMLPFAYDQNEKTLSVVMKNPLDLTAIDFAEQKTGLRLVVHYAMPSELERTISERYAQSLSTEVTQALQETNQVAEQKQQQQDLSNLSGEVVKQAPITKIVETILAFAVKSRASDVHIEPQLDKTRVRYRIDGLLVEKLILPASVHDATISRIKILSDLKIDEKRVPQDGRFNFVSGGEEVDLRVSTLPTIHGEKVVMRLLKKNAQVPTLGDLGLRDQALRYVEDAIKVPHGIVLVTGPTGSGKTTTLYSVLHRINTAKVNIVTLEDPVEYQMSGVNQVQINPQAGLTFASGLRSFLRQDPNIIMVGEIRDSETVELAIQAALTGHLVFSTLHTSSAAGALPRLIDMGAEPFLLASSMTLTMAQRIVRCINPDYKEEYQPEPAIIEDMKRVLGERFELWCRQNNKDPNKITLFRAKTDRPQTEPDYKGRVGIFEVMPIRPEISKMILESRSAAEIETLAQQQGMLLMKQDGYLKALEGITTIEEVLRVAEI